jgi:hypothetical protein
MGIAKLKEIYIPVEKLSTLPFRDLCSGFIKINNKEEAKIILTELYWHPSTRAWSNGQNLLDFKASQIFTREDKKYFPKYLIVFGSNGNVNIYHSWMNENLKNVFTINKINIMDRIKKLVI